jgi:hypothetical protein
MSEFTKKFKKIANEYASLQVFAKRAPTAFKKFADDVEHLAADTYAHGVVDGYCCACDIDQAFFEHTLLDQGWTPPDGWVEEQEKMQQKILEDRAKPKKHKTVED